MPRRKKGAPKTEEFVKKSVSMPPATYDEALERAKFRGYNFSAYIAWLIERDLEGAVEREQPPPRKRRAA